MRVLVWSLVVAATASCITVVRTPTMPHRSTGRLADQIPTQCFAELGTLNGIVDRRGTLTSACWSPRSEPQERSARFFRFTLKRSAIVKIDMTSSEVDPYLTLWETTPYNPMAVVVESDDDGGEGLASRIHRTLSSGTYTVEATTYDDGTAGTFQLLLNASMVPDAVSHRANRSNRKRLDSVSTMLRIRSSPTPRDQISPLPLPTSPLSTRRGTSSWLTAS